MEIDTAKEFALCMSDIVDQFLEDELKDVQSFEEAGVLTSDAGFVVRLKDGSEFQVTVVKSR